MKAFDPPFDATFERALIAARYLLGARGEALTSGLPTPSQTCTDWTERLSHHQRQVRATSLAAALAPIAQAVEARRLR